VEESCKLGKVQGRCEFLEAELGKVRKECDEAKKVALKSDLLEAELGKAKKEIAEREDTYVSLWLTRHLRADTIWLQLSAGRE
jgi:hypothetical protein